MRDFQYIPEAHAVIASSYELFSLCHLTLLKRYDFYEWELTDHED